MFIDRSQVNKMDPCSTLTSKLLCLWIILFILVPSILFADNIKQWVFFNDKGEGQTAEIYDKALNRRLLRGTQRGSTDLDIYPDQRYIESLKAAGLKVHRISRWLNAASVSGSSEAISRISELRFVKKIQPVAAYHRDRIIQDETNNSLPIDQFLLKQTAFDYGPSYFQLHLCQIDSLHSLGYSGQGVLIGVMDTGFKLNHPAFSEIIESGRLIATYDFINDDEDVQDTMNIQQEHGTAVWAVIGAFAEDTLIGSAFGADFMLAKTEIKTQEIRAEEDNWIAAAEWMEAQGADIISSSLGYIYWYDQSDLDGNTCAITIAADIAASLGVAVVNSAGNERSNYWDAVTPPADGNMVIAAGGITSTGNLWSGSSPGPTADGRIKPDVAAMALFVRAANYLSNGYNSYTGTSFAAPIISGGLALIIEAHPEWDLMTLIYNLRKTASNASSPNNDLGWGIARFNNMYSGNIPLPDGKRFFVAPNPAYNSVVFHFDPPLTSKGEISVFTVSGDKILTLCTSSQTGSDSNVLTRFLWNAEYKANQKIASGIYIAHLQTLSESHIVKFAFVN